MLLYLTKYSRPDIFNVLKKLCKYMDVETMETNLEMLRLIKLVLDTENFRLKIRPKFENKNWNMNIFRESD
jgi:hypothetical protein